MRNFVRAGVVVAMVGVTMLGCEETENPFPPLAPAQQPDAGALPQLEEHSRAGEDAGVVFQVPQDGGLASGPSVQQAPDAGAKPLAPRDEPVDPEEGPTQLPEGLQTEVPSELVGAWADGAFDFELWENYREGYWAGRNATPTREAMIFDEDGVAKFYRYEAAFNFYEELIDCEGTVAFHDDGTFTFYPLSGRKRFHDFRHSEQNVDRSLTAEELVDPDIAGTRAYTYDPSTSPGKMQIRVPSSAPYNWYKQE